MPYESLSIISNRMELTYDNLSDVRADFIAALMEHENGIATMESIILKYLEDKTIKFRTYGYGSPKHMSTWEVSIFNKTEFLKSIMKVNFVRRSHHESNEAGGFLQFTCKFEAFANEDTFADEDFCWTSNVATITDTNCEDEWKNFLDLFARQQSRFELKVMDQRKEMQETIRECMASYSIRPDLYPKIKNAIFSYLHSHYLEWDLSKHKKLEYIDPYLKSLTFLFE